VPATMRLHFPGGGVLRVEGTVEGGVSRRGIMSLKLTATPDQAGTPAPIAHAAVATASDLLAAAISAA